LSDIKYTYPLILNKVSSPHYATPTLRRARLIDWLNDAASCRAAVIAADAGYGKTTLLWQWEREVPFPCYWYKLDRNDRDWTFHISYLIEAISKRHAGFGRRAHSILQQMGGPGSSRPGVAAYLLAEMHDRLTEPCTFIIDDWHYVNAATEVRGLWNQILRDAPATCRFVFASRVKPRLQFARFKTHGGYAELRTDSLRFNELEIDELFRDIYNDPLEPAEVAEIERRTEGWAASLQLVEVSLRERTTPEERRQFIHSMPDTTDSDLFDFLAEEVLDQQPEETRNFLLSTSILQQITPEVAERLAGVHDGRRELNDLEHRGLFTNRLDEVRYRYHNLFREFLERRLHAERTREEVVGLHIHAASYFETTSQWPEAIHHYLRAGLQRQAARLIAKYGEDVVAEGRLGLVDEWLQQLPDKAIRENARLSLLYGETCGIRGAWTDALEALERARAYFSRKGDRRLEALACLKLSSVHSNYGDAEKAAAVAEAGVELVPADAFATRLRLEGNLVITRCWLSEPASVVVRECQRIAVEARARGLDHFSAIALHNAGAMLIRMGRIDEALANLERATRFWSGIQRNPFADHADLALALLASGQVERAHSVALDGVHRTEPWPWAHAAALDGHAAVLAHEGRHEEAIARLTEARATLPDLGSLRGPLNARLIEYLYLARRTSEIVAITPTIGSDVVDRRLLAEVAPAQALAAHVGGCSGDCTAVEVHLDDAQGAGADYVAIAGRVKIGVLLLEHGGRGNERKAWSAIAAALEHGYSRLLRYWTREYVPFVRTALRVRDGLALIVGLAREDPDAWRSALVELLRTAKGQQRHTILAEVQRHGSRDVLRALQSMPGQDIAVVRRQMQYTQAARVYLRTLGGLALHRGRWTGAAIPIDKRRARSLLGVLAAHTQTSLSRDAAIDLLWPESDGDASINSLNQTVFQLRRYLDPGYRAGESPEYIVSTSELVGLDPHLFRSDVDEILKLPDRLAVPDPARRAAIALRAIELVRGEFLADLRYETWISSLQMRIHTQLRSVLLPIALGAPTRHTYEVATRAATALLDLDPYDEAALLALAECLAGSGRRFAARTLLVDYAQRVLRELDEEPSEDLIHAAAGLGATVRNIST
jgi:DNA-binding SARP family transcriptional activator/tetratricopeptide (TPR) repeat protein